MTIITDSDLHDSLCQICIESPHSLLSELGYAAKQKIIETTVCISYKKGDLIYQEGDMPTGLHCLLTGKAKIYKEGIGGRQSRQYRGKQPRPDYFVQSSVTAWQGCSNCLQ